MNHGGNLAEAISRFGGEVGDWLDLSTGINPLGWPVGKISPTAWTRLPGENEEEKLLVAGREYYGASETSGIVCANGTQAIIQLLPQVFSNKCTVEIVQPTYSEHAHCWHQAGYDVSPVEAIDAIGNPDIAVVVNPNNPDARVVSRSELVSLARRLDATGGVLIVDEAFGDCFPDLSLAGCGLDNVIVLKSFGKFFGLAGVRLGFAIGGSEIITNLHARMGPWAVSGPALEIGTHAFGDRQWIARTQKWILSQSQIQMELLHKAGLQPAGNGGLFLQTSHERSAAIYDGLGSRHILVRKFVDRKDHLRFGLCANDGEIERLVRALGEILNG